ncbi:right-handed parallel beta-helix repeat-containing protein [Mariniflexile soesokkakense]|uniref:Right-handed parallel beta-helix repeat-containing protein n=1 Tax=Mariniflexile soesokkakense TaxID=1343160 RepID=A0ABV0AC41_9FLAO
MTFKPMLFVLFLSISLISCNNEELFVEPTADVVVDDETNQPNDETSEKDNTPPVDASSPCEFNLNSVQPNSTVIINCSLDLGGQTINLPNNVTIVYEGGEIINGTLNFSGGNVISGDLLNSTLTIGGSKPLLKDPVFNFIPSRWGIVEGKVSDAVALSNRNILNSMFSQVKNLGVNTFRIDKMDAYFLVSKTDNFPPKYRMGDIFLPSNFNLVMTDNTHLRVQPNGFTYYNLLAVYEESNVTITGGHLHGDREEHTYIGEGGVTGHGASVLLNLEAAANVTVDGVDFQYATADGILIKAVGFSFNPDYNPSRDILIKNCVLNMSRRNNISIVNAHDVIIENCQILNAGVATSKTVGTLPKLGIDIEALRDRDANGNFIMYEIVKNVIIRNNVERGSVSGGFLVAIGDDTIIENNDMENSIGYGLSTGVKIRNNKITGTSAKHLNTAAIGAGDPNSDTCYNNEVSGNIVKGYEIGVSLYARDAKIYDNTLENLRYGIFITNNKVKNTDIYNNTIKSSVANSFGFYAQLTALDNINITGNKIDVKSNAIAFVNINLGSGENNNKVNVNNNSIMSSRAVSVENSLGISLLNNN